MNETTKLEPKRRRLGYYKKYFTGKGIEIGGWNDPLTSENATIHQHTLPDGSTHILNFPDNSFDFLYASHVLEHFEHTEEVLREWIRVVKNGGYIFFAVPDFHLYEKSIWPSKFNTNHKAFFTVEKLNADLRLNFPEQFIEFLYLENNLYDYSLGEEIDQTRLEASCQIDCCIKLNKL